MDGLIRFVQQFVDNSIDNHNKNTPKRKIEKWKYCVALEKAGYKAACETIKGSGDLLFVWNKESEEEIRVRLSFAEQQMWLNFLEKRSAREKSNDDDNGRE